MNKIEWSALEYVEKERGSDWFWALGVVVVASSLAALIYSNYFFAALIILSGILLGIFAIKKPDEISYELNDKGLQIRTRLYPYENIKSFWVQKANSTVEDPKATLFIKSERVFMPIISIPIDDSIENSIDEIFLSKNISQEEMKEHVSDKIIESLGF